MKLRNKKTGEYGDYKVISAGNLIRVHDCASDESWQYDSLVSFNDKWEDYKSSEPLIKDEKIRKAVRAWAEANNCMGEVYHMTNWRCSSLVATGQKAEIKFNFELDGLEDTFYYTITELCGEEEE